MADILDDHDDDIEEFDDLDEVEDKTEPETHLTDESDIAVAGQSTVRCQITNQDISISSCDGVARAMTNCNVGIATAQRGHCIVTQSRI